MSCRCSWVRTDCCGKFRSDCKTVLIYDADGTPDVRICDSGHGCQRRRPHLPRDCGACVCVGVTA